MQFTPVHVKNCLDTAQNLREVYFHSHYNPSHSFISVNALLKIVKNTYKKNVTVSFLNDSHEDHYLYSFLHANVDGSYHICLLSKMSNCWNRFALCKELFHVILDEEGARNISLVEHLQDFKAAIRDDNFSGRESSKIEILTEFAAMQFLFPFAKREVFLSEVNSRIEAGEQKKLVMIDIARRLRMPRLLVEEYLDQEMVDFFGAISWNEKSDGR